MNPDQLPSNAGISLDYVITLERRIMQLENQIKQLDTKISQQQTNIFSITDKLPNTTILSKSFLTRAFTIWGHTVAAQLMISLPLYCLAIVLGLLGN